MPLVIRKGYKRNYAYGGRGLFDTMANLLVNDITKKMGEEVTKKVATDVGRKLVTKGLTPKSRAIIDKYSGNAIAIQDLVKKLNLRK